jgi:hypothetical protein
MDQVQAELMSKSINEIHGQRTERRIKVAKPKKPLHNRLELTSKRSNHYQTKILKNVLKGP